MAKKDKEPEEVNEYDLGVDDEREVLDPKKIDFSLADPDEIVNELDALQILSYLRTTDRSMTEDLYYQFLMKKFDVEEEDPTKLTNEEAFQIATSFKLFVQYMFLCEYGFKFKNNWHHEYLYKIMEDVFMGRTKCPRVIINMPPRFSKTQILIYFVAWSMGHVPDSEFIWISYTASLSAESSGKIREILQSEEYRRIFDVELDRSTNAKDDFKTTKKGKVFATSTGGTLTGKGAGKMRRSFGGCIIVDDGNNTLDAFSEPMRRRASSWVANTLMSRRNHAETPILVIAQRVHEEDITGFLLPSEGKEEGGVGEKFEHIVIPAILTREQLVEFGVAEDSPSWLEGDPERNEYPLWPEKLNLAKQRAMRDNLPALTWFGQYMQNPSVDDGNIFKVSWFRQTEIPPDKNIKYRVMVCDTAQTKTKSADFSVIMIACILVDGTAFIEHIHRERMEAPVLAEKVIELYRKWRPRKVYIEYKSSGIGLYQYLKIESMIPIKAIARNGSAGDGDSVCRANGASPYVKLGNVAVHAGASWLPKFFLEVSKFPVGGHDDQVDCLTDLVAQEISPNGARLEPMDVLKIPVRDWTYEEEVRNSPPQEGDSFAYLLQNLGNYRGKPKESSSQMMEWANKLGWNNG